ncbi:MAG: outer membrane beta-barrel family protein [Muribaculaceae bacterium]|nr:outer membrane beta-barrel family protein [Muribaculaceae bacterium]
MKRYLLPLAAIIITVLPLLGAEKWLYLQGRVKESFGKTDLTNAYVITYDSLGNPKDSIQANQGTKYKNGEIEDMSYFGFPVERKDSTYIFDVVCKGYLPQTVTYRVEKVGKRERFRSIPTIYLEREPHKLGEVTVTASKIKFYNKGDTIVFNADAFQLAEGSMLDALISQLPGVKLEDGGVITVNGQQVESLLLNGKEFLDGNNQLMLENIGAYTVKNIEVYEGQTALEKWINDSTAIKHLTMDVKLKREYNQGWIINAQGGYGTEERYTGRLFASWFTPRSNVTLLGNINNLNDNRKPGKSDSWRPEMMPSGTKRYKMGAVNYEFEDSEEKKRIYGHATIEHTGYDTRRTTARTNFLQGGDTYDNSFSSGRTRELKFETRHTGYVMNEHTWLAGMFVGRYGKRDNGSNSVSGTFREEQQEMTLKALEAIYSDGTPEQLDAIINRSITRSDASSRNGEVQFFPDINWKIPGTNDRLSWEPGVKYKTQKEERWNDYNINYGSDPTPAHRKRQFTDNSPNHELTIMNNFTYRTNIKDVNISLNYEQRFYDHVRDSYQYALDRLDDMGIYGTLPEGWLATFDPANSYTSRLIENTHTLSPRLSWARIFSNKTMLFIRLSPDIAFKHSHLNYERNGRDYLLKETYSLFKAASMKAIIDLSMQPYGNSRRPTYKNILRYTWDINNKTPNMLDMIDVVDDSDPLNIVEGNPDLKTQYTHNHMLMWILKPNMSAHPINNTLTVSYNFVHNSITRGYTYDTSTGVRHTKSYNVDGNSSLNIRNGFNLQFGSRDQFTFTSSTSANLSRYADMIGVNLIAPEKYKVNNRNLTEDVSFAWQIGKQNLRADISYTNRHTTSERTDFNDIDANHFHYGLVGTFNLPQGFGITTDFSLYTRRGYGVKELDTTDAIWNLRLSWTPRRASRWTFMVDGFDMLHQLSNVNYAVNANGRTVSYTNALPRYILFSAQYRLNIQPKKRK